MVDPTQIAALADGHLTHAEAAEIEKLMAADPELRAEYEATLHLKRILCEKLPTHDCATTLKLCKERVRELRRVERTEAIVGKYSYTMAAVIFFAIVGAAVMHRISGGLSVDRSLLERSLSASVAGGSAMSAAPDRAEDWLRRELSRPSGFEPSSTPALSRVEVIEFDGHRVGRRIYTDGMTTYTVLIMPDVTECRGQAIDGYPGMRYARVGDVNIVFWCEGTVGYAVAAQVPLGAILRFIN
jgi:hypothetical protein